MTLSRIKFQVVTALAAAFALTLSACGTGEPTTETTPPVDTTPPVEQTNAPTETGADEFPVTIDTPAGQVTIDERPESIVSLSPSATEILFAIGAGDQVVATDSFSYYPEEAPTTDLSGYDPNIEAIVGYEPDLVVAANDINELVASLEALDIPVIISPAPADIESGYNGMAALGTATGHSAEADEQIEQMRAAIDEALADAPQDAEIRVYHELDETYFSASSFSYIGSVYSEMGAVNIADEADVDQTGYPQLTEEAIIEADPQLIIIPSMVSYTAEDVAARPGWSEVSAVVNGDIIVVDSDISSRWGPRLPQLVEFVAESLNGVAASTDD